MYKYPVASIYTDNIPLGIRFPKFCIVAQCKE